MNQAIFSRNGPVGGVAASYLYNNLLLGVAAIVEMTVIDVIKFEILKVDLPWGQVLGALFWVNIAVIVTSSYYKPT